MEYLGDGSAMYMSSSLFGSMPGGAKWMKLDLPSGEGPTASLPADGDVYEGLKMLEHVGYVEEVGTAQVRGVSTTRYRGSISAASTTRVEVWIDAQERVRRMRLVGSGSTPIDMTMDFVAFGPVPEIAMPSPSEILTRAAWSKKGPGPRAAGGRPDQIKKLAQIGPYSLLLDE